RQFGLLELHSGDKDMLETAGKAILDGIGAKPQDQLKPSILFTDIIEDVSDQHAIILNRTRGGSMLVPGSSLLVCEMSPALFACVAANEAEKAVPQIVINDVEMMGASGRIFFSGEMENLRIAQRVITETLEKIEGRSK
ncbi:MAG: microcompartment protein, partial [Alphaproteobacteria bacterium]